jgi:hypothetical protein
MISASSALAGAKNRSSSATESGSIGMSTERLTFTLS